MKRNILLTILYGFFFYFNTQAQVEFGNEWIDLDKNYYKIEVSESKLYRIPFNVLQQMDLPLEGAQYQLFYMGEEIPIHVSTEGTFGAEDYIEFYGERLDGTIDQALFLEPQYQLHNFYNLFTDTSRYFLSSNNEGQNLRYQLLENSLENLPPKEEFFTHTVVNAMRNQFFPGNSLTNFANEHNYYAEFGDGEGFASSTVGDKGNIRFKSLTPSVYMEGESAIIETRIVGWSDDFTKPTDDHHTQIRFNGELYVDTYFEGRGNIIRRFNVPLEVFEDEQIMYYESLKDEGVIADKFSVSYYTITYPRTFEFDEQTRHFTFELSNDGDKYLEIKNFGGGTAPVLHDLTNHLRLQPTVLDIGGDRYYRIFLPQVEGGEHMRKLYLSHSNFEVGSQPSLNIPAIVSQVEKVNFVNHKALQNQGTYIILTHPSLMEGSVNQVERYLGYRKSAEGGGHQAVVVDVEELYNQFAYGVEKHPSSIRNFLNYVLEEWTVKPQFLFLLGKSVSYNWTRTNNKAWQQNLVPTFGHVPSDNWLSTPMDNSSYKPRLATGRIPATNPQEIQNYLDKVISYETIQTSPCTKDDRLWAKHAMHLAGGLNLKEEEEYSGYIDGYSDIFEDRLMGGKVVFRYSKASDNVIEAIELDNTINDGVSIINFFGHSSGPDFNIPLGNPLDFENFGKYPMIIGSSCFTGNIHRNKVPSQASSMAETWVLAKDLGAIGYMSSTNFGFPTFMDIHVTELYENMCIENYHEPIGKIIQQTILDAEAATNSLKGTRLVSEQFALTCDPALIINSWEKPELFVSPSEVFITPSQLTTNEESFAVDVVVTNLGKATMDSVDILVRRTFPDDSEEIVDIKKILMPLYADTIRFYVQMGERGQAVGLNSLTIEVDYQGEIEEDCEDNNFIVKNMTIFSELLDPISPCDFAIVTDEKPILLASTGESNSEGKEYLMQIDTTTSFNSSVFQEYRLTSKGGLVEWQPPIDFVDQTVYYWRASPVPVDTGDYTWLQNSFIYAPESKNGWNQSHFYQFQQDGFHQMTLNETNRNFEYTGFENDFWITNQRNNTSNIGVVFNLNLIIGQSCLSGVCRGGIVFAAFKPSVPLDPLLSVRTVLEGGCNGRGTYGNIQCSAGFKAGLEFHTGTPEQLDSMLNFMYEDVPDGYYVLSYSVGDHRLGTDDTSEPIFERQQAIFDFYENLGVSEVKDIRPDQTFILFGKKGSPNLPGHFVAATEEDPNEKIELRLTVSSEKSGDFKTEKIGPSKEWKTLEWDYDDLEPFGNQDEVSINVYGVPAENINTETLLFNTSNNQNTDLSSISAENYPFLRLQALTSDTVNFTAPQMNHWRVFYESYPEFTLNRESLFEFYADTLQEGEMMRLKLAVTNASEGTSDSLSIYYAIYHEQKDTILLNAPPTKPFAAKETIITEIQHSTEGLVGYNELEIKLNPNGAQPEKYSTNNTMLLPFVVVADDRNPVLDVTFDGRHILDGDLVSANPEILIRAKDENPFLELNDVNDFGLTLEHPDGTTEELSMDDERIQFIPATQSQAAEGKNEASITYTPELLQDGTYTLTVNAKDRTDNRFAPEAYKTSFEVVNEHLISNVLNYPNPFTSSTQFIFTLTGSEVPERLSIQIMTISGKIVREISREELGELFIGRNRTDFTWDGTDQFGNRLANGVYLYRVNAYREGETLDQYNINEKVDGLFKNGWGKMYLMR